MITDIKVNLKDIQNQSSTLSSNVKKFCGSSSHRIHPKGRDAFHTPVFWRISESVNDIWPHILALPDLSDPTVGDKVLLLHFDGEPFGRWMPQERKEIKARADAALPAYLHFLTQQMEIPSKLRGERFDPKPYKNRAALEKYFAVTQEARLLELIDEVLFKDGLGFFKGRSTAETVEDREG